MLPNDAERLNAQRLLDVLIRAGLIAVLAIYCYGVFRPFLGLVLWSLILAVSLYPLHVRLRQRVGSDGRAATVIVVIAIAAMLAPVYFLGMSLAESAEEALRVIRSGDYRVPPPPDSVATWPIVGGRLHAAWLQASTDLTPLLQRFAPQLTDAGMTLFGKLAGVGVGVLMLVGALVIAGVLMASGASGYDRARRIASRLVGPERGPRIADLCTATIRAVAQGVVGIAFIQALLVGIGFLVKGVPGAGLLAMAAFLLGITQLPGLLLTVPVIAVVLAMDGVTAASVTFSIYTFIAGLSDNVLKPLLLGRGLEVPMPVIFIGAVGGMITNGIIGLFIGPVALAVGYQLFWQWVDQQASPDEPGTSAVP